MWSFKPRPDDVWIVTYPKCGTTMTQELVWQMFNLAQGGRLDGERSKEFIFCRVPFIEMAALARKGGVPPPPQDAPETDHRYGTF